MIGSTEKATSFGLRWGTLLDLSSFRLAEEI